jgi:hypothetical protein
MSFVLYLFLAVVVLVALLKLARWMLPSPPPPRLGRPSGRRSGTSADTGIDPLHAGWAAHVASFDAPAGHPHSPRDSHCPDHHGGHHHGHHHDTGAGSDAGGHHGSGGFDAGAGSFGGDAGGGGDSGGGDSGGS